MVVLIVVPKLSSILSVFTLSMYVVNECCMKSLGPAFCWNWTYRSVLRAPTTTIPLKLLALQVLHELIPTLIPFVWLNVSYNCYYIHSLFRTFRMLDIERSLHIINKFKTFVAYIFDVILLSSTCMHIQ